MRTNLALKLVVPLLVFVCVAYILMAMRSKEPTESSQLTLPALPATIGTEETEAEALATKPIIYKSDLCIQRGIELNKLRGLQGQTLDAATADFLAWAIPWWEHEQTLYCAY